MFQDRWLRIALLGLIGAGGVAAVSQAATIDTFDFSEGNLNFSLLEPATGQVVLTSPIPGATISGSFTGTVEPDGLIEQADLTAFSVRTNAPPGASVSLSGLTLFSYNTTGGVSSLDLAASQLDATICVGAAATLSSTCTSGFTFFYPFGTNAVALVGLPIAVGSSPPTITLVSSVTTTPVPEPASLAPFVTGLGLLTAFGLRRKG